MKIADTNDWQSISSLFNNDNLLHVSLLKGRREIFGHFQGKGKTAGFWSDKTDERNKRRAIFFDLFHNTTEIFEADCDKALGLSILCIRNN